MEICLAKTAGFCFGVDRAVQMTCRLLDEGKKVATLGPLIHNPQVVADLERRGAKVVDSPRDVPAGYQVVIRSHGVPQNVYDELAALGVSWQDATCPFVAKIHAIARRAEQEGVCLAVATRYLRVILRSRASWAIPGARPSSSGIWPNYRPGKALKIPKNVCLWWLKPPSRQQNGKNVRSF